MVNKFLKYDYLNMSSAKVGDFGYKNSELTALGQKLTKINAKLKQKAATADLSFRQLPYDQAGAALITAMVKDLQQKFETLVVVGIGGSDLGAKTIVRALAYGQTKVYFSGDTTDPVALQTLAAKLNLKKTLFYIVSKSGNTLETLASFLFWQKQVINAVGAKNQARHFIVTTNLDGGKLLALAQKNNYAVMAHYPGGGRFSALSVNGLLPAAWLGLDLKDLLTGAQTMDKLAQTDNFKQNLPFIYASLLYLGYTKRNQKIAVLMPYAESLNSFSFWYRQLLAESLGKKYDLKGKLVHIGLTPIAASGPKDQHSQLQLYNEGKNDKIFTFIRVDKHPVDFKLPATKNKGLEYLANQSLTRILNVEQQAVAWSLMKNQRANGTIILPALNSFYLGQLLQFFELATVYLGELLGIDVFNQPGVEDSKKMMMKMLK